MVMQGWLKILLRLRPIPSPVHQSSLSNRMDGNRDSKRCDRRFSAGERDAWWPETLLSWWSWSCLNEILTPPDEMDCLDGRDNSRISFFPKRPLNRRDTERPMLKCESGFWKSLGEVGRWEGVVGKREGRLHSEARMSCRTLVQISPSPSERSGDVWRSSKKWLI